MMASSDAECDEMLSLSHSPAPHYHHHHHLFRKVGLIFLNNSFKLAKLESPSLMKTLNTIHRCSSLDTHCSNCRGEVEESPFRF